MKQVKNKVTYMSAKPTKEDRAKYYNTFQITLMLNEMEHILGTDAVLEYIKQKTKFYKDIKKEGK